MMMHDKESKFVFSIKVNGKFVALDTKLRNGDRVEIETKKNAKPSRKWLEYCKTTMAKRRIQHALENQKK